MGRGKVWGWGHRTGRRLVVVFWALHRSLGGQVARLFPRLRGSWIGLTGEGTQPKSGAEDGAFGNVARLGAMLAGQRGADIGLTGPTMGFSLTFVKSVYNKGPSTLEVASGLRGTQFFCWTIFFNTYFDGNDDTPW